MPVTKPPILDETGQAIATAISNLKPRRNIGEIVYSTVPLTDAGLHLANGDPITRGAYAAFYDYIVSLLGSANSVVSFSDWQTERSANGGKIIGKYGVDTANQQIYLPDLTGTFPEATNTASELGEYIVPGIPNIKGGTDPRLAENSGYQYSPVMANNSGALTYRGGSYPVYKTGTLYGGSAGTGAGGIAFNAANGATTSGIYRDDCTTVQPPAVKQYIYIVVATSIKPDYVVDIDELATEVSNMNNLTTNFVGATTGESVSATFTGKSYVDFVELPKGVWLVHVTYLTDCTTILCKNNSYNLYFGEIGSYGGTVIVNLTQTTVLQLYINTNDSGSHIFYRWGYNFLKLK